MHRCWLRWLHYQAHRPEEAGWGNRNVGGGGSNGSGTEQGSGHGQSTQKLTCRILVAEDSPDIQFLIESLLCDAGAEVELAENGQIALDLALAAQQAEVHST